MGSGFVTIRRTFVVKFLPKIATPRTQVSADVAVRGKLEIMVSNGNYHFTDEKSFRGTVIPPESPAHGQGIYRRSGKFRQESPAHGRGIYRRSGYSARNHQLMDKESTGGMAIPPGITSSWTRNLQEE
jgi:hypothetical protein